MTAGTEWLAAFPQGQTLRAVQAVKLAWQYWGERRREGFHPDCREPQLTRVLLDHVFKVTAPQMGLLGHWGTEGVENDVDEEGRILEERRTDILYSWNDDTRNIRLVFEFKKLSHTKATRDHYIGANGMQRFVSGMYSKREAASIMVGILMCPEADAVEPLRKALQVPATAAALRMLQFNGDQWLHDPSDVFPGEVSFDTEHEREPAKAPAHGTIRIGHLFLPFAYPIPAKKASRTKALAKLRASSS